ncbi:MAG: formate hydrogenlyase maturation protein HycH [Alphaproteobacteria bacterium]|nr:formate hydrogenlyase maturation protein HycH [Alphaproteobacteria bacterium]
MSGRVVFYQLSSKFLQKGQAPPPDATQVLYYSLGVGHHVGVIDTFKPFLTCDYDRYLDAVALLPEGEAKRKLEGLRRFGEIAIDASHTASLRRSLDMARTKFAAEARQWTDGFDQALQAIDREPALTLMVRRQA